VLQVPTVIEFGSNAAHDVLFIFHPDKIFLVVNNISEKIVFAINRYNQKNTSIPTTTIKYFCVSAFVGQTTCFKSLIESLKKFNIYHYINV
jgi:hypothetical protein